MISKVLLLLTISTPLIQCQQGIGGIDSSNGKRGTGKLKNSDKYTRRVCRFSYAHDWPLAAAWPLKEKIGISWNPHLNISGPQSERPEHFNDNQHIVGTKLALSYPNLKQDQDHCLVCYGVTHQDQKITIRVGCHNGTFPEVRTGTRLGYPEIVAPINEYPIGGWESNWRQMVGKRIHIFQTLFRPQRLVDGKLLKGHTYDFDACTKGDDKGYCIERDEGAGCQVFTYFIAANSPGILSHQCWMLPVLDETESTN